MESLTFVVLLLSLVTLMILLQQLQCCCTLKNCVSPQVLMFAEKCRGASSLEQVDFPQERTPPRRGPIAVAEHRPHRPLFSSSRFSIF
jgi:hypothetical protein